MPYRKTVLGTGEIYHILNRGVEKRDLFINSRDHQRFIENLKYYQTYHARPRFSRKPKLGLNYIPQVSEKSVTLICYVLMPNHFHLLLKQLRDGGILDFITRISNSYGRYFNTRYKRSGHLFEGPYKAIRIESDEHFVHVSRYIHLNPIVGGLTKNLRNYQWSSYCEYTGSSPQNLCQKEVVLNFFAKPEDYEKFVLNQIDYAKRLKEIRHLLIDS